MDGGSDIFHVSSTSMDFAPASAGIPNVSSAATLELLAQAGIEQPVKRQIQLHSELARHITNQKVGQHKPAELHTPLQVF